MAKLIAIALALLGAVQAQTACIASGDETTITNALRTAGANGVVQLCAGSTFKIFRAINFTNAGQELSTQGYPTGSTRATIIIDPTTTLNNTVLINGGSLNNITVRNLIVDGNRPNTGHIDSEANIVLGGGVNLAKIFNVQSKNPRGWSCMHIVEPANNFEIAYNDFGPCGTQVAWSDGISFAGRNGYIHDNVIVGPTDGGIVLFGAPGTRVINNTIISSDTERGFGAINMVDKVGNNGNFSGVEVRNNTIVGKRFFNMGISIGSAVWFSQPDTQILNGPAVVDSNTFSGNIAFPVAVNGWKDGITVTNSNVAAVSKPNINFAEAYTSCGSVKPTWRLFNNNTKLVYYPPGVNGTANLPGFTAVSDNPYYFLCPVNPLPTNQTYPRGSSTGVNAQLAQLHGGIVTQFQGDNNLVTVNYSSPDASPAVWASGHTVSSCGSGCSLTFTNTGNLVNTVNGTVNWQSNTTGTSLVFLNQSPWVEILDAAGKVVWTSANLK